MEFIILVESIAFIITMSILLDWLIYKHRGRAQPDDPNDKNLPVITSVEDARAQRLADLYTKDSSPDEPKT